MLVWNSTAVAVKNDFFCPTKFPIMIEHKKLSGFPAKPIGVFIRRNFYKRFVYKYIDCVYAAFVCVFLQVCRNFFSDYRINKVKYATAENNVIVFGCTKISYIRLKKVYISITFFRKLFPLFYSGFRQIKSRYNITVPGKKTASFPSPQPISNTFNGLTGGRNFIIS